ncbi:MAG: hypothetical protein ABI823_17760 [Bryobacteraceae bacterium]
MLWAVFAICAALSWGFYGPALHKGQTALQSPFKALLCVGVAYFLMGVIVPLISLGPSEGLATFTQTGWISATVAGGLGALGAVFIILAFKDGGIPNYVMPLVFCGAPVVNVLYTMYQHPPKVTPNPMLWVGMVLAFAGAGMVLFFKPQG